MTTVTIRELEPTRDFARVAAIQSAWEEEPLTEAILADRDAKWPANGVRRRTVAVREPEGVVGFATAERRPYALPGHFWLTLVVEPAARCQGAGRALYDDADTFLRDQGAVQVRCEVREGDESARAFSLTRGFRVQHHYFESVLNVAAFDPAPFAGALQRVQENGIRFLSLAETDGGEAAHRKLYELNTVTGLDEPGATPGEVRPFEQFARDVFGAYWFRPGGQVLAADGERWVGLCAVGETAPGRWYNMCTGVLREYRGRGIAQALKVLAVEFCRRQGAQTLRANNNSTNAAMVAINRKLGYRPEPGWYVLAREMNVTG